MSRQTHAKTELSQEARRLGVDLTGVASADRFAQAPEKHRPTALMPDARSVIVLARRMLSGPMKHDNWPGYTAVHDGNVARLDHDAYYLARFIEERYGADAISVPAMAPYTHWDEEKQYAAGDLSHKHAAVAAGLGVMGKNSLLITPRLGNRVNLVSIVTNLTLDPDPLVNDDLCAAGCRLCVDACPAKAI